MSGRTSDKRWKGKALKNAQSKHECRDGVQSGRRLGWVATVNRAARLVGVENRAQELPGREKGMLVPVAGRCACAVGLSLGNATVGSRRRPFRPWKESWKKEGCWNANREQSSVQSLCMNAVLFSCEIGGQQPAVPCKPSWASAGIRCGCAA